MASVEDFDKEIVNVPLAKIEFLPTPYQCAALKESWELITLNFNKNGNGNGMVMSNFVDDFYKIVFELDPASKLLFGKELLKQGRAFVGMLSLLVQRVDQIDDIYQDIVKLGQRHI
eukprot:Pgem_evm1s9504